MRDRLIEIFKKINYNIFPDSTVNANLANQFSEYTLNDIVDKLIENNVIALPVGAGDTIYRPFFPGIESWVVTTIILYPEEIVFIDDSDNQFKESDIGKTVFLTRGEAENALKERERG